jgi:hypothetical protein
METLSEPTVVTKSEQTCQGGGLPMRLNAADSVLPLGWLDRRGKPRRVA